MHILIFIIIILTNYTVIQVKMLSYDLSPGYISVGDGFIHVCTFNKDFGLSRGSGGDICMIDCNIVGCNLQQRTDVNCSDSWIQVYISPAEEGDFGTWRCSADEAYIDRSLSRYGMNSFRSAILSYIVTQRILLIFMM